jgi:hypothetical protein
MKGVSAKKKHRKRHIHSLMIGISPAFYFINPEIAFRGRVSSRPAGNDPERKNQLTVFNGFADLQILPDPNMLAGHIVSREARLAKKKKGEKKRKNRFHGQPSL